MKVAGCLNNNLAMPSFKMNIDFDPENVQKLREDLPNFKVMEQARQITNTHPAVRLLPPDQVLLKYVEPSIEWRNDALKYLGKHEVDTWILEADGVTSDPIKIPRDNICAKVMRILVESANGFAQKCVGLREAAQDVTVTAFKGGKKLLH